MDHWRDILWIVALFRQIIAIETNMQITFLLISFLELNSTLGIVEEGLFFLMNLFFF